MAMSEIVQVWQRDYWINVSGMTNEVECLGRFWSLAVGISEEQRMSLCIQRMERQEYCTFLLSFCVEELHIIHSTLTDVNNTTVTTSELMNNVVY